jgi:hypothetical protein
MKRKKKFRKKKECKIENVNNFSLRLKIEMIIFIISHQMYYNDFYYISSTGDIEHKVNWGFISWGCIDLAKNKKTHFISFMNFNHFDELQLFHIGILNIQRFLIFV